MKDTVPGDSNDSHTDVLADCFAPVVSFRAPNSRGSVQFQVNPGRLAAAPRGYLTAIAQMNSASLKVRRKSWPRKATQADRALQKLDEEDGVYLAGLPDEALRRIAPRAPSVAPASFSQLIMTLIAAAVRHAIALEPKQAARMLALFKRMLPKKLAALEM